MNVFLGNFVHLIMSVSKLYEDLNDFINQMKTQRDNIALKASRDAIALATDRMINTGEFADGRKVEYSEFTKKLKKKSRRANLDSFPYMNFSETNQMWRNVVPIIESSTAQKVSIRITSQGPRFDTEDNEDILDNEDVLFKHEERFDIPLTALNEKELDIVLEDWRACIAELLDSI